MFLKNWPVSTVLLLAFFGYLLCGLFTLDPDFGWHIRAGQYIIAHGIEYKDPFSYSMPSYLFVDHEWLTNIIWDLTFSYIGYWPLAIVYALFAAGAIFIQIVFAEKKWLLIPVFLVSGTFVNFVGVRTQLVDWLLLSVLLLVLWKKNIWKKYRFFLPVLFLLWANIHGGFGIGVGVLGIVLIVKSIEEKKDWKQNLLLLVVCTLVTLINPFGIRLWGEFWNQLSDTQLHSSISEWYPAIYFSNVAFWIYVVIAFFLIIRYWRRYSWNELILCFALFLAALSSMRNIPLWEIASFSLTVKGFSLLEKEAAGYEYGKERLIICYRGFFIICCALVLSQLAAYCYGMYTSNGQGDGYPEGAVNYLQAHLPKNQIFSSYNWGGYLLWKLPEKKEFIDGRMPSWRWHLNSPTESNYAFDDYKKVLDREIPFSSFAQKYHITTLLVGKYDLSKPKPVKILGFTLNNNSLLGKLLVTGFNSSFYWVVVQAKKMGWKEVYHDNTAVVFEKE